MLHIAFLLAELVSSSALLPPLQFRSPQRISQLRCIAPAQDDETDALLLTQPPPSAAAAAVSASLSLLAIAASFSLVEPVHAASATAAATAVLPPSIIFETAAKKALGGGISGFFAGIVQVLLLMWLRTTMNYQYRNGGSTRDALAALYAEGGLRRFYRGVSFALIQTPLSRFGDTAANTGVLALLADSTLPVGVRTAFASAAAAAWRIGLTPIDTLKTTLQVKGAEGYDQVSAKVKEEGPGVLFQGALANAAASFVGNYPWYLTFNSLNEMLPTFGEDLPLKLARTAVLGIAAAGVSDTMSNSIRVLKTVRAALISLIASLISLIASLVSLIASLIRCARRQRRRSRTARRHSKSSRLTAGKASSGGASARGSSPMRSKRPCLRSCGSSARSTSPIADCWEHRSFRHRSRSLNLRGVRGARPSRGFGWIPISDSCFRTKCIS